MLGRFVFARRQQHRLHDILNLLDAGLHVLGSDNIDGLLRQLRRRNPGRLLKLLKQRFSAVSMRSASKGTIRPSRFDDGLWNTGLNTSIEIKIDLLFQHNSSLLKMVKT